MASRILSVVVFFFFFLGNKEGNHPLQKERTRIQVVGFEEFNCSPYVLAHYLF
jgi:hypothetical protein